MRGEGGRLANDENTVLITLTLRNGMDSESTEPRQMTGYSVASTGLAFNDMNCVSKIVPGRPAALDGPSGSATSSSASTSSPGAPAAPPRGEGRRRDGPSGAFDHGRRGEEEFEFERSSQGGSRTQFGCWWRSQR